MKKFIISVGLVAAGTASLHALDFPGTEGSKMWSVQATLRGFYDDNYLTRSQKEGSLGFEVSPQFQLNVPLQQTEIGLKYTYGLYYYQKREDNDQKPIDQTHQFDLWLDHAFSPRWDLRLEDSVAVTQDPLLTSVGTATPQRISGNNVVNNGSISLHTVWTRKFSTQISYGNASYFYDNDDYASTLDRIEQTIGLEGQWQLTEKTVGSVGYKLGLVNYTGDEIHYGPFVYDSDVRDNDSHYGYVGLQHQFLENLSGHANVGVQYADYYNDPDSSSSFGPYADLALTYTYTPGGYIQVGFTEMRNSTETVSPDATGQITLDQESSVLYGSISHPLTAKLTGSLVGHYQHSIYNEGQYDNDAADFYNFGVNLSYDFTRNFSADVGYDLDYYSTPVPGQTYSRNRIYLGVTASY